MMPTPAMYLLIGSASFAVAALTLLAGFGLGTLLLPAFAIFFPAEIAVAMVAVVHALNNLFKLALLGRRAAPAEVPARLEEVELVIGRGAVVGAEQIARRRMDRETEGIAQAAAPLRARRERVRGRTRRRDRRHVVAQDLARE